MRKFGTWYVTMLDESFDSVTLLGATTLFTLLLTTTVVLVSVVMSFLIGAVWLVGTFGWWILLPIPAFLIWSVVRFSKRLKDA